MARILIIDNESMVLSLFESILQPLGHEVLTASSGRMGVEVYRQHRPVATILEPMVLAIHNSGRDSVLKVLFGDRLPDVA